MSVLYGQPNLLDQGKGFNKLFGPQGKDRVFSSRGGH